MKSENIEIEVRGLLTESKYTEIDSFLKQNGNFIEEKNRLLIDYSYFLPDGGIESRERDIRLRITNGQPEIVVKVGKWGNKESRLELSAKMHGNSLDELIKIFYIMGYSRGMLCHRLMKVYVYKNIELALVTVPGHSYYFEAEMLTTARNEVEIIHNQLELLCQELELQPFSVKDFNNYLKNLNTEVNIIFDYEQYIKGKYKKYRL